MSLVNLVRTAGVVIMSSLKADEVLEIIKYQWAGAKEIAKLGNVGYKKASKIRNELWTKLDEEGYALPRYSVPMNEVTKYFNINIDYLKKVINEKGD